MQDVPWNFCSISVSYLVVYVDRDVLKPHVSKPQPKQRKKEIVSQKTNVGKDGK